MRSVSRTCRVSDSAFRLGLFAWDKVENHACHRRREHQVLPFNPASSVRGPKHVVKTGKTPVLSAKETRALLDGIDVSTLVGLRDRALLGVLVYSFARVSAAGSLRVADYYTQGPRSFFRLHEKGGRYNVVPAHHTAQTYVDAYLIAAAIGEDRRGPLFRSCICCVCWSSRRD